jgi:hypothetical protein
LPPMYGTTDATQTMHWPSMMVYRLAVVLATTA